MNFWAPRLYVFTFLGRGMSNYSNYYYPITCFLGADREIYFNTKAPHWVLEGVYLPPHLSTLHPPPPPWDFQSRAEEF